MKSKRISASLFSRNTILCNTVPNRIRARGFTLIEILIAIVIVAILSSIAVPAYKNYVIHSRRTDAIKALNVLSNMMETCRSNSTARDYSYAELQKCMNIDLGTKIVSGLDNKYYDISVTVGNLGGNRLNLAYDLIAKPKTGSSQAGDNDCAEFHLDQRGTYSSKNKSGVASTGCWKE